MKSKLGISLIVLLAFGVSSSFGAVGWAGNIWPVDGTGYLPTDNIGVYVQVWKDGCTGPGGPCAGLAGWLYYKKATDAEYDSVLMSYNVPVGNNDEFMGTIPALATQGGVDENFYCRIYDSTDASWYDGAQDQNSNSPPFTLPISEGTSQDVTVTFRVDMNCVNPGWYSGGVFFTGDFLGWGTCLVEGQMSDPEVDGIWEGTYLFVGGFNPSVLYKFQRNDGSSCYWECGGNRSFTIDDASSTQVLDIDIMCCEPWYSSVITGPGSYCIGLCCCDNYLEVPLDTPYDPPVIVGFSAVEGCDPGGSNCDDAGCSPGKGTSIYYEVVGATGAYALRLCIEDVPSEEEWEGCFCITIDQILPVELATFEATPLMEAIRLDWTTASEENNNYFVIERSQDQTAWNEIDKVEGAGTTPTGSSYSYTDENLMAGTTYYYRLSNVDIGGARNIYEQVVSATPYGPEAVTEYMLTQNYPNPFNPTTSISYTLKAAGTVTVKVFSITGREVATLVNESQDVGVYSVTFDGAALPSGIYIYRLQVNDFTASHKMVLMK